MQPLIRPLRSTWRAGLSRPFPFLLFGLALVTLVWFAYQTGKSRYTATAGGPDDPDSTARSTLQTFARSQQSSELREETALQLRDALEQATRALNQRVESTQTTACPTCAICPPEKVCPTATASPQPDARVVAAYTQPLLTGVTSIGPVGWDPMRDDPACQTAKWSQDNEDRRVFEEFFSTPAVKRFGTVLEMGALDGHGLSNSLFFERCLQWRSILIEGQPLNCEKLFVNRPRANAFCQAICGPEDSTLEFTRDPGPIAGVVNTMSDQFKHAFHSKEVLKSTVTVPCGPLSKLLTRIGVRHIDFFSLDVEGAELAVLDTIDFTRLTIDVMMVERDAWNEDRNLAVQKILIEKAGMKLHSSDKLTPRSDLFYRPGFKEVANYYTKMYQ